LRLYVIITAKIVKMGCTGCNGGCNDCGGLECGTGAAGLDGLNAFTETTANFTVPAIFSSVAISVSALGQSTGLWAQVGQVIFIVGAGYYKVVSATTVLITATNLGYAGNAAAITVISLGAGVGPAGIEGTAGSAGSAGTDGVTIMFQNIGISSPATIGSGFTAAVFSNAPITIPANTLLTVGDMLRIEITFLNDHDNYGAATIPPSTIFNGEITFGGSQVWEGLIGTANSVNMFTGRLLTLDLIVSATNTLSMRLVDSNNLFGDRSIQQALSMTFGSIYGSHYIPPVDSGGIAIGAITPTLTNSNDIVVNLKNSTNNATHIASVTSMLVTKFLKS